MEKDTIEDIYTIQEFADKINCSKQWVHFKIREAEGQGVKQIIFYKNKNLNKPIMAKIVYSKQGSRVMLKEV